MSRVMGVLIAMLALAGCSDSKVEIKNPEAMFKLTILDERPAHWPPTQVGLTTEYSGFYHVEVLRAYYPECLEHEVRHVVEWDWHGDMPTTCRPQRLQSES